MLTVDIITLTHKNAYQREEQKSPDSIEVHRSVQLCGAGFVSFYRRLEFIGDSHFGGGSGNLWTAGLQDIRSCSVDEISLAENPIQRCGFV